MNAAISSAPSHEPRAKVSVALRPTTQKVSVALLMAQLREPPYYLGLDHLRRDFARGTINMALAYANRTSIAHCATVASAFAEHQACIYTRHVRYGCDVTAEDFVRESTKAMVHCLRTMGEPRPTWAARSIMRIGHFFGRIPPIFGVDLLKKVLLIADAGVITWPHLAELSWPAYLYGPPYELPPRLVPWFAPDENANRPVTAAYRQRCAANRKIWELVAADTISLAQQTVKQRLTPQQLETQVNLLLGLRPRGRPRKRVIDPQAAVRIAEIPVI